MTKTIEEMAELITKDFILEHKSRINNDAPLTYDCVEYTIKSIFSQPLASRLTAEEKERIRREYSTAYSESFGHTTCLDRQYARGRYQVLREIFGADFFKEGE